MDIGVALRRPPTYGETSAALLDLLRHGVATIVTDVDTFADYSDTVVRKVHWPGDGIGGLTRVLLDLAADHAARASLGRAAQRYVREDHAWSVAASRYAAVIDRLAGTRAIEVRPFPDRAVSCARSA